MLSDHSREDPIAKRCNFSLALRGSVLVQGESDSDLDLCFLCEERGVCSVARLKEEIAKDMPDLIHRYGAEGEGDHRFVVIWLRDGRHIDAQFWLDFATT